MNTCRLCNSPDLRIMHQVSGVTVQECGGCGFVQVADMPRQEDLVDLYSPTYFDHGKYTDSFSLKKENQRRMALIKGRRIEHGARILDVGCATGDFLGCARPMYDMWGLDVSEFAVRQAQQRNPDIASQISAGFLEDHTYPAAFFDAILMWDVLEHLWKPVETCRKPKKPLWIR